MMVDVTVPLDSWEAEALAVVVSWLYADGASVPEGAVIAEVMIEKVQLDIIAPIAGRLSHKVDADGTFERGEILATIDA